MPVASITRDNYFEYVRDTMWLRRFVRWPIDHRFVGHSFLGRYHLCPRCRHGALWSCGERRAVDRGDGGS